VGGAAINGRLAVDPLVCPVVAEIQQLVLPVKTYHQLLSELCPTSVTYVPWAKEVTLS
jgi:hypothetical protein